MTLKTLFIPFSLVAFVMATGCSEEKKQDKLTLANPASKNCVEKGGELEIAKRGDGGQYGICYFEDNRQCEEWALMRGKCPLGGVKITGYTTPEGVYCALSPVAPQRIMRHSASFHLVKPVKHRNIIMGHVPNKL